MYVLLMNVLKEKNKGATSFKSYALVIPSFTVLITIVLAVMMVHTLQHSF